MKAEKEEEEQTHRVRASTNPPALEVVWRATRHPRHGGAHPVIQKNERAERRRESGWIRMSCTWASFLPGHHMRPEEAHPEVRSPLSFFFKKKTDGWIKIHRESHSTRAASVAL